MTRNIILYINIFIPGDTGGSYIMIEKILNFNVIWYQADEEEDVQNNDGDDYGYSLRLTPWRWGYAHAEPYGNGHNSSATNHSETEEPVLWYGNLTKIPFWNGTLHWCKSECNQTTAVIMSYKSFAKCQWLVTIGVSFEGTMIYCRWYSFRTN